MFNWLRRIKTTDEEAEQLIEQAHRQNQATVQRVKIRSEKTSKQADKMVKRVYDVAERIHIATGQHQ